jgi:hypothetical protein
MKMRVLVVLALVVAVLLTAFFVEDADAADTVAQPVPPAAPGVQPPSDAGEPARAGEPAVRRTVIDDGRARIEELRVRGQLQKITVAPKGNVPGYEILLGDGVHPVGDDPGTSRGSAGKRVWNVLRF